MQRRWPRQKDSMLRILKRSTPIPADFDAIDSPDGILNKDDDHADQKQNGRQWPHQRGTMLRILKRSTAIPADFDAIYSPDGTLNKDDDYVDQIQEGRQWPHQRGTMLRILKRFDAIDSPDGTLNRDDDLVDQIQNLGIAGLDRGAGSRPYFRTLRVDPEMKPLSLQNRMLLRLSKR